MKRVKARVKPISEWPPDILKCGCGQKTRFDFIVDIEDTITANENICGRCGKTNTTEGMRGVRVIEGGPSGYSGYVPICTLDLDEGGFSDDR